MKAQAGRLCHEKKRKKRKERKKNRHCAVGRRGVGLADGWTRVV